MIEDAGKIAPRIDSAIWGWSNQFRNSNGLKDIDISSYSGPSKTEIGNLQRGGLSHKFEGQFL